MAEVKKKFSALDPGNVPATGTEILAMVQGGVTVRGTVSGIHGAGWWDKLKAAFVDFVAPEALHANDADTLGGETSADLRNAGALTGTLPLGTIPAELTGKNAATASSAAKLTNARTITLTGNASGSVSFDGTGNVSINTTVSYAASAGSASSASYATSAGSASYATSAGSASYATSAGSAGIATRANLAYYATLSERPAASSGNFGSFCYVHETGNTYISTFTASNVYSWKRINT
jgi:hypothetical protein